VLVLMFSTETLILPVSLCPLLAKSGHWVNGEMRVAWLFMSAFDPKRTLG